MLHQMIVRKNDDTSNKRDNSEDWNLISNDKKNKIIKALPDEGANGGIVET